MSYISCIHLFFFLPLLLGVALCTFYSATLRPALLVLPGCSPTRALQGTSLFLFFFLNLWLFLNFISCFPLKQQPMTFPAPNVTF